MKTTIEDRQSCLWRGGTLPETIFDAATLRLRHDDQVVFSCEIQSNIDNFSGLLERVGTSSLRIYYPSLDLCEGVWDACQHDVVEYLANEGLSESVYLMSDDYLIYSNSRDTLSIIVLPSSASVDFEIEEWDAYFRVHIAQNGIGFGKEGHDYATSLIESFMTALPNTRLRFENILS